MSTLTTLKKLSNAFKIDFKSPLIPLFLLVLIDHIGFGIFYPILVPVFMDTHGILGPEASEFSRSFWYNITLAVFPITLYFGATFLGSLSDRFGRKKILLICLLGTTFSYLLAGIAIKYASLPLILISRIIAGLTSGTIPIAQASVVDTSTEETRAHNLGLLIFSGSLGFLVGPLLAGFCSDSSVISWFSYSTPFYMAALLGFLNIVLLFFLYKETFVPSTQKPLEWFKCVELAIAPFMVSRIRFLSMVFLVLQLGWGFYFQFVTVFLLKKYDFNSGDIGQFMSCLGIGFALGSLCLIRVLSRYFKDTTVALMCLLLATVGVFSITLELSTFFMMALALVAGACMAAVYSLIIKFFSNIVSKEEQGWIMGVSEALVSVAWGITPLLSTYLEQVNLSLPIQIASFFLFVSFLMLMRWKAPQQEGEDDKNLTAQHLIEEN